MVGHLLNQFVMTAQEPGSNPGSGLKLYQTFLLYVVTPVGLFLGISAIVLLFSRPKRSKGE